jgi:lipopolysaccharide/colanic/teichoic acid biosynthesis glycosyltransferase
MVRLLLLIVLPPALITFIFQKIIFIEDKPWMYRVSFLIGFFVTLYWVDTISVEAVSALRILGIFIGAFAGGLVATALDKGLWEKSFPPSPQIEREILEYHEQVIENLKPVNHRKRRIDLVLALTGLIIFSPLFIFLSFLIWFEDPGPIFFVKYSTGKGGSTFSQLKFRSMIQNAEQETGPIPASIKDPRRLSIGRVIRLLRVDEIPQLFNILRGEMSLPRGMLFCQASRAYPKSQQDTMSVQRIVFPTTFFIYESNLFSWIPSYSFNPSCPFTEIGENLLAHPLNWTKSKKKMNCIHEGGNGEDEIELLL